MLLLDNIPAEVALCLSAICTCVGPACTQVDPVEFDESASPVPTGLIYDFATHVSYSLDGVDFSYVPFPDIDGFDDAVRYVRIAPEGLMNAPTAAGDPEFHLRYMVRLE